MFYGDEVTEVYREYAGAYALFGTLGSRNDDRAMYIRGDVDTTMIKFYMTSECDDTNVGSNPVPEWMMGYVEFEGEGRTDGGELVQMGKGYVEGESKWTSVTFGKPFASDDDVVVAVSITSYSGKHPTSPRVRSVTSSGFEVVLQERGGIGEFHLEEEFTWVAVPKGTGTVGGVKYAAMRGEATGASSTFDVPYGMRATTDSVVLVQPMAYDASNDPSQARLGSVDSKSVEVRLEGLKCGGHTLSSSAKEEVSVIMWGLADDEGEGTVALISDSSSPSPSPSRGR